MVHGTEIIFLNEVLGGRINGEESKDTVDSCFWKPGGSVLASVDTEGAGKVSSHYGEMWDGNQEGIAFPMSLFGNGFGDKWVIKGSCTFQGARLNRTLNWRQIFFFFR